MEKAYEGILYKTLDSLNEKLANAYKQWEEESMWIQVSESLSLSLSRHGQSLVFFFLFVLFCSDAEAWL